MNKEKFNDSQKDHTEDPENNKEELNQPEREEISTDLTEEKIKELEKQSAEWQDKFLRKVAEFENYKRRSETDQLNLLKYAAESFIIKLLPVVDDFERSISHLKDEKSLSQVEEGIKLVYNKLIKTLEEQGVKKIESIGKPFDVNFHEAVMQMKNESVPPHTVLEEVQTGYLYKDRVIRHSKVIVSDESAQNDSAKSEKE